MDGSLAASDHNDVTWPVQTQAGRESKQKFSKVVEGCWYSCVSGVEAGLGIGPMGGLAAVGGS